MNLYFYEGPAGSGKTTSMIERLEKYIKDNPLMEHQLVLGLTMMHGARHRLVEKLNLVPVIKNKFLCSTFDSFAWKLLTRWKSFYQEAIDSEWPETYEQTCLAAARLLSFEVVRSWVSGTFPIILVDEAQDCKGARLKILKKLVKSCVLFVAADEFQDLYDTEQSESVLWLRSITEPIPLHGNHRTNVTGLLEAARSLREGKTLKTSSSCNVLEVPSHHVAAHIIAYYLLGKPAETVSILTPTNRENSNFVSKIVEILCAGMKLKRIQKPIEPFKIEWENSTSVLEQRIKNSIGLNEDTNEVIELQMLDFTESIAGLKEVRQWIEKQQRYTGKSKFTVQELSDQISVICQQFRSYHVKKSNYIRAMTIHQAKNQEFDYVVILWPYQVSPNSEVNRRLLYNGITRAKKSCIILVQGLNRINDPPFV